MYLYITITTPLLLCLALAQDPFNVQAVRNVMLSKTKSSWEFGTVAQTLLELDNADLSVFGPNAFSTASSSISSLSYARSKITLNSPTLCYDRLSNADPASLGVAAVMLGKTDAQFMSAAKRQLDTLLNNNARTSSGAISHRKSSAELWSDSVFMFPPFLAYYAGSTRDNSLLDLTVRQLELYREGLRRGAGTWMHIAGGNSDSGHWSSGNGWAAMGMTRVLATILVGPFDSGRKSAHAAKVTGWIKEIIDGAMKSPRNSAGLLPNYLDNSGTFGETSGTSLLAAVVYRMAVLAPNTFGPGYIAWAKTSLDAISRRVGSNGVISPAVNPYNYRSTTPYTVGSPEGQAWALMLYASHRDCIARGICQR